jgi:hypothetical protein
MTPAAAGAAALPTFTACVPTNDMIKTGTTETEVIPGPNGDVTVEKSRGATSGAVHRRLTWTLRAMPTSTVPSAVCRVSLLLAPAVLQSPPSDYA